MKGLILKGPPNNVPFIDKGIGEFFFEQTEKYGDKIFQIDGGSGETETYRDVKKRSTRIAIHLQKMGIKPKNIVLVCCRNNKDNIIPALSALYLGAYVAFIDPKQTISEAIHIISLIEPRIIFVENNSLPLVEKSLEHSDLHSEVIVIGKSDKYKNMYDMETDTEGENEFKPIKQKSSDIAGILFSSGTTGSPKGIYISNSYVLNAFIRTIQHHHVKPGLVFHCSTLYWTSGWLLTGLALSTGTAKIVAPTITGEKFLQLVEKYKITYLVTSCTFTYEITNLDEKVIKKYDTSSLYSITVGGSTVEPQQILRLRKLLPHTKVGLAYGSTEGNVGVFCNFSEQEAYDQKPSSSGTAISETEVKVVDLETGKSLGPNQEGEILVKSPYSMSGYHKFEKPDAFDKDGFLKMGDIGYYDEDQHLYVIDRIGDMFKYQVNHLSPSIIEHTLLTHPAVAEATAFGVPHPVDRNHPGACVILKESKNATVQELVDFVNSRVSNPYRLRAGLMIIEYFPKTPSGKIQRRTIRDQFIKANNNKK